MFALDANVLLDSANYHSPFHSPCRALVEKCRTGPALWFLTWGVCYQFLRVSTHARVFPSPLLAPEALGFLLNLMSSAGFRMLTPTEQHAAVLAQTLQENPYLAGNVMHDVHIAVLLREHGVHRIYTRDTDFHKFKFLQPMDPTAATP